MQAKLNQVQRVIVAIIYLSVLVTIFNVFGGNLNEVLWQSSVDTTIWFYAGALLIILGGYLAEPFFSKPTDSIMNAVAIIIALLNLNKKGLFWGYDYVLGFSFFILGFSLLAILLKDIQNKFLKWISRVSYFISVTLGHNKVVFSAVYLPAVYSYFACPTTIVQFICLIAFWICVVFFDIVGKTIEFIAKGVKVLKDQQTNELGRAFGCENPFLYKVEIDFSKHKRQEINEGDLVVVETKMNIGSLAIVVDIKHLINKQWLNVYLLNEGDKQIQISLREKKLFTEPKSIFSKENIVYRVNLTELDSDAKQVVEKNDFYINRESFIGYVERDSNINTINFSILVEDRALVKCVSEGAILKTIIYDEETLYQVINGNTKREPLENHDTHGYSIGIARKLGKYIHEKKELEVRKWLPNIYAPVYLYKSSALTEEGFADIAKESIGRLPGTDLAIPINDFNAIITHNTAVLGILGIGKSSLAFELIKKSVVKGVKIICIDITNQYFSPNGLPQYIESAKISNDLTSTELGALKTSKAKAPVEGNPQASGNSDEYKKILDANLVAFFSSTEFVKIFNPDIHPICKGVAFKNTSLEDLTPAEKTRIITERVFAYAMSQGQADTAKYLIVYEEAHSLIPEWNSVSSEGDKAAANGTAKVILQGRKFGLGCLVVTQRTANVSKSILNQCNTIFAMRIFDDTGKGFLENYIGSDYADTLPTLEERHAIAIGRGLKLKQPVILELNDWKYIKERGT